MSEGIIKAQAESGIGQDCFPVGAIPGFPGSPMVNVPDPRAASFVDVQWILDRR